MVERKSLSVLDSNKLRTLAPQGQGGKISLNSSKKRKYDENQKPSVIREGIFEDPVKPATKRSKLELTCTAVQTEAATFCSNCSCSGKSIKNDEPATSKDTPKSEMAGKNPEAEAVINMLTNDKPNEKYWQMIATERKSALICSLKENKQIVQRNTHLQGKVQQLSEEVQSLKTENILLEDMLDEAKKLALLIAEATAEETSDNEEESEPNDQSLANETPVEPPATVVEATADDVEQEYLAACAR